MQLSDKDILYLARQIKRGEEYIKTTDNFNFRPIMRAEAAKLLINLAGYHFDYETYRAYKITSKEKREYLDATTTD